MSAYSHLNQGSTTTTATSGGHPMNNHSTATATATAISSPPAAGLKASAYLSSNARISQSSKYPSRYDIPIQTQTGGGIIHGNHHDYNGMNDLDNNNNMNNMNNMNNNPVDESMTNSINHMMNNSYTYNYNPKYRVTRLPNPPSFLQYGALQFMIMDAPTDDNLRSYIKELNRKAVRCVVRTCEPTYSEEPLMAQQINVRDLPFSDGHPPPDDIINQWLDVVNDENYRERRPVAVHCVAGLGRAPVLVAIALMEIGNIKPLEAIHLIRKIRRGAINQKQYQYLKSYVRKSKHNCCGCTIL